MTDGELQGRAVEFVLPVTLSRALRRDVFVRTGIDPTPAQIYVVNDFAQRSASLRTRIVDVWEKITVAVEEEEHYYDGEAYREVTGARADGYLWLHRDGRGRWVRHLADTEGESVDIDEVFFATAGRTIGALDQLRSTIGESSIEALDAMLVGAPLVEHVAEDNALGLTDVLDGYDQALGLAERLIDLVDTGTREASWFRSAFEVTDEAVFFFPAPGEASTARPAAILKEASPVAYQRASDLLSQVTSVPVSIVAEKIDRVCVHWWSSLYAGASDERKVEILVQVAVKNMLSDVAGDTAQKMQVERYEKCRADWIREHGSQRLKRAAARAYRHDGIYRDERLERELPGFVGSLGRKPTIRELVNPSEDALEVEERALARAVALGIDESKLRLVYVQTGSESDWSDGEFVQIEGYLGRHTIWQSVSGSRVNDDIPF
jgi:hypothetical protein